MLSLLSEKESTGSQQYKKTKGLMEHHWSSGGKSSDREHKKSSARSFQWSIESSILFNQWKLAALLMGFVTSKWQLEISCSYNWSPVKSDQLIGENGPFGRWTLQNYTPLRYLLSPNLTLLRFHPKTFQVFPTLELVTLPGGPTNRPREQGLPLTLTPGSGV